MVETYSKSLDVQRVTPADSAPRGGTAAADVLAKADHLASLRPGTVDSVEGVVIDAAQVIRELRAQLAAARERIAWAEEILQNVEDHAPKDYDKDTKVEPPFEWYMTGVYVREYRAEYPKAAQDIEASD